MKPSHLIRGKYFAARSLLQFMRHFDNWQDVWSAYRVGQRMPAFRFRNGLELHHGPSDDPITQFREIFVERMYDRRFYRPAAGHTIIDLGANVGFFALYLTARCRDIRIHSFEPGAEARHVLQHNIATNDLGNIISVYPLAVSNQQGVTQLYRAGNTAQRSMFANEFVDLQHEPETVETITLDDALDLTGAARVDLLKIDTEGSEIEIVEGASPDTWRRIDRVVFEFHDHFRPESRQRVSRALQAAGFQITHVAATRADAGFGVAQACR